MGQEEMKYAISNNKLSDNISRNFFDFQYVIGKGGFGKVISYSFNNSKYL